MGSLLVSRSLARRGSALRRTRLVRSSAHAIAVLAIALGSACASRTSPAAGPGAAPAGSLSSGAVPDIDAKLAMVVQVHGGSGPWAVAGYRMGEYALQALGLPRGSFDLEVVHFSPREVQYSCIADGAAAATGASLGKLNLSLAESTVLQTHTVYRRRSTGKAITLRVTSAFAARYLDVPRERLAEAGREVMGLRDEEIFEVVAASTMPG
jgi:formylmethanofuran dehydrogenase subunit E